MPKHHTLVGIQSSQAAWRILATTIERLISVSTCVEDFEGDGDVKRKEVAGSSSWRMGNELGSMWLSIARTGTTLLR